MKGLRRSLKWLVDTNTFERRAIIALLFFVLLVCGKRLFLPRKLPSDLDVHRLNELVAELDSVQKGLDKQKSSIMLSSKIRPNKDTYAQLVAAGLPSDIASNMVNYRKGGGRFRKVADLLKLYKMNRTVYEQIQDSVEIEGSIREMKPPKPIKKVDINAVTAAELLAIPGIGKAISFRVINYRKSLGGYVSLEQLKEVYALSEGSFQKIVDRCTIDTTNVQRFDINTVDFASLIRHPYLNKEQVVALLEYRDSVGHINEVERLMEVPNVSAKTLQRILPYFQQ